MKERKKEFKKVHLYQFGVFVNVLYHFYIFIYIGASDRMGCIMMGRGCMKKKIHYFFFTCHFFSLFKTFGVFTSSKSVIHSVV